MMNKFSCEEALKYIEKLKGKLIIVEGPRDSNALKSLGLKNTISLNGKPLHEVALYVSKSYVSRDDRNYSKEVVILTDFDSEGKKIAAKLDYLLRKHKVMVNSKLRGKFMKFGKSQIEDIKEGDIHGKVSSNVNKIRDKCVHKGQRHS